MSTNRIIFRYVLGVIAEAALIAGVIYGLMWLAVWASGFLTAGTVTLLYAATFAAAIAWMWWDSKTSMEVKRNEKI